MNLSPEDAGLYYKLMWALQTYVGRKLSVIPDTSMSEEFVKLPQEARLNARQGLYNNIHLIDSFTAANPDNFSPEELAIVKSWKHFVKDRFFISRFLKKGTIFIGTSNKVYLVLGLADSLEDMFWGHKPPIAVETYLLPFKGQIIYDGLMSTYSIYFGAGIRSGLHETYMSAKQKGTIIESFEAKPETKTAAKNAPNPQWSRQLAELTALSGQLKGKRDQPLATNAFSALRATAELAEAAVNNPDDLDQIWKAWNTAVRALNRLETNLRRAE